jgi:hypothetical protein
MNTALLKKTVAIVAIIALFFNLLFFALRLYSELVFWIAIGIIGIASISVMKFVK